MHTFLYALLGVLVASCGGGGGGGSGGGSSIIPTMPNIIEQPKKNFGNDKKVEESKESKESIPAEKKEEKEITKPDEKEPVRAEEKKVEEPRENIPEERKEEKEITKPDEKGPVGTEEKKVEEPKEPIPAEKKEDSKPKEIESENRYGNEKPKADSANSTIIEKPREEHLVLKRSNIKYTDDQELPVVPEDTKEKVVKVGILDSDFKSFEDFLTKKYKGIKIVNDHQNGEKHGRGVLYILANDENFQIIAAGIGEKTLGKRENVNPSLDAYKKVWAEFDDQKVKIINQSWGANAKDDKFESRINANNIPVSNNGEENRALIAFFRQAVDDGGLFVFAGGNSDRKNKIYYSNATIVASFPKFFPETEKGWLAAIGANPSEKTDENGHFAYAGIAKNWAITSDIYGKEFYLDENSPITTTGSSNTTPRVTRAAAQVYRKFSWMTNSQVKDTLLTTTDDLDKIKYTYGKSDYGLDESNRYLAKEAEDKYGWGFLNTKRALRGPGRFINILLRTDPANKEKDGKNYFQARIPENTDVYFENNIDGDSGLHKSKKGRLHLLGKNTYTGENIVSEGELHIYKLNSSINTKVEEEGKLVLHNKSYLARLEDDYVLENSANIENNGVVALKGDVVVAGNIIMGKKGNLEIDKDATLTLAGDMNLDKSNIVKLIVGENYIGNNGEEKLLIKANKIITEEAPTVLAEGMYNTTTTVDDGELSVTVARENAVDYLSTSDESSKNTAENVEKVLNELDKKLEAGILTDEEKYLGLAIETLTSSDFTQATQYMSGEIYASAQALSFAQARDVNKVLGNRLSRLKINPQNEFDWNAWVTSMGGFGKLSQDGYASAKTKIYGGQFGVDKKLNPTTQLGVAMTFSHGKAEFDKYAGEAKSESVGVSLYGRKDLVDDFYVSGRVGGTTIKTKVQRELLDSNLEKVNGNIKHDDFLLSTYLEVEKDYKYFTPYIGYSFNNLKRGSFSESNAAWGIHAGKKNYNTQSFVFGFRGEYEFSSYKLNGYLAHEINIGNRDLSFEGNFTGIDVKQRFKGIDLAKHNTWGGIGVTKQLTPSIELSANLDFLIERNKIRDNVVSMGIKYSL